MAVALPPVITIHFRLHYLTEYGENIRICGNSQELGHWDPSQAVTMSYDQGFWRGTVRFQRPKGEFRIKYKYFVESGGHIRKWEDGDDREVVLSPNFPDLEVRDEWRTWHHADVFCRSAFKDTILRRNDLAVETIESKGEEGPSEEVATNSKLIGGELADMASAKGRPHVILHFDIAAPHVEHDAVVVITGAAECLGNWKAGKGVSLTPGAFPRWYGTVAIKAQDIPLEYKFVCVPKAALGKDTVEGAVWEGGKNRTVLLPEYSMCWNGYVNVLPTGARPGDTDGEEGSTEEDDGEEGVGGSGFPGAPPQRQRRDKNAVTEVRSGRSRHRRGRSSRGMALGQSLVGAGAAENDNGAGAGAGAGAGNEADMYSGPCCLWLSAATFVDPPESRFGVAGVAIPVFSLRSSKSMGVGEFLDLKPFTDWSVACGMHVVQILPVNDTRATGTWVDTYPYNAVSCFALHPIYIRLSEIPGLSSELLQEIEETTKEINAKAPAFLEYELVMDAKHALLEKAFADVGDQILQSQEFKEFYDFNQSWLKPYAVYCLMRDLNRTADWQRWGKLANVTHKDIDNLASPQRFHHKAIQFSYFHQFIAHTQLREAALYATDQRVVLKGDLPIGVALHSADAWVESSQFRLDQQAGAPPDMFAKMGQNWGFPTYNWEEMAKDGYSWWRRRLRQLSLYFQAFRIDHILGFFRIWEIPRTSVLGLMGRFHPAVPLHRHELEERGIWDLQRLLTPYIRDWTLQRTFHDRWVEVASEYLECSGDQTWQFKGEFDTEVKLKDRVTDGPLLNGLLSLMANVVLLADEHEPHHFHFRIEMHTTSSFEELPDWMRSSLYERYIDYYYRRQEGLWRQKAMEKLPMMKHSTGMLVCGEDLGMVPACVPGVMDELSILSLQVERMPSDPAKDFNDVHAAPYLSVVTTGSHDTTTLRQWWEEDRSATQRYYNGVLGRYGAAPEHLTADIAAHIVANHLRSPSMLAILPFQDYLAMDTGLRAVDAHSERINDPAVNPHYWRWRMHLSLDDLIGDGASAAAKEFNARLRSMVKEGKRVVYDAQRGAAHVVEDMLGAPA